MRGLIRGAAVAAGAAVALQGLAAGAASVGSAPVLRWSPPASSRTYSYGLVGLGHSVSKVFTLTNTGSKATGSLRVKLTGSATFTMTKDSCHRVRLRPHRSCKVTVAFSPRVSGLKVAGTLTAASAKPAVKASLTLKGMGAKRLAISTRPSAGGPVGSATVTDTAILSGGAEPTGTITFALHGPSATASCSGSAAFSRSMPVKGDRSYTTPAGVTPSLAGTYWWTVTYSGDASNNRAATKCGAESVIISKAVPTVATVAKPTSGVAGTMLKDTATLAGGHFPGGGIEFRLYSTTDCSGSPVYDETVAVAGDGSYTTLAPATPSKAGTYEWTASYSGNINNMPVATACGADPVVIGYQVGFQPDAIAFDGTNTWVAGWSADNVTELSPSGEAIAGISVGDQPDGIAFDGTNMWVSNYDSNTVTEISPNGTVLCTCEVGRNPAGIAFDGTNMWVANYGANTVTEISPNGTTIGGAAVGKLPVAIASDGTNMWVVNYGANTVTKLSTNGAVLGTFPVGSYPDAIAFDGTNMWVANSGSDTVTELSPNGTVIGTFPAGSHPAAIAFDGTNMWVADEASDNVSELSPAGTVISTFPAGAGPDAIAFDGKNMWIADYGTNEVAKIPTSSR